MRNKVKFISILFYIVITIIYALAYSFIRNFLYGMSHTKAVSPLNVLLGIVVIVLIFSASIVFHIMNKRKGNTLDLKAIKNKFESTYEYAKNNLENYKKKIKKITALVKLYIAAVICICFSTSLFILFYQTEGYDIVSLLIGIFYFLLFCGNILNMFTSKRPPERGVYIDRKNGGFLYDILEEQKKILNINMPVHIHTHLGVGISVSEYNKCIYIAIGADALNIFTKEEIQAIFLHELSHVRHEDTKKSKKYSNLINFLSKDTHRDGFFREIIHNTYYWASSLMSDTYDLYSHITSLESEILADEEVKKQDMGKGIVTACIKMDFWEAYNTEPAEKNFYENENPPDTYFTDRFNYFKEAAQNNEERYYSISKNSLPPKKPTHPTVKERMEMFKVENPKVSFIEKDSIYKQQRDKLMDFLNEDFKKDIQRHYTEERREYFLEPLKKTKEFLDMSEDEKKQLKHFEYAQYGLVFENIANIKKANELYDKALEAYPESTIAQYYKGRLLLSTYDDAGIDMLKKSTDNPNYLASATELIMDYISRMGLTNLKEDFTNWSMSHFQKEADTVKKRYTADKKDMFKQTDIKAHILQDIYECAKKHLCITEIKAINKISKDGFTLKIVGLILLKGSNETSEDLENAYNAIFSILDNTEEEIDNNYYLLTIIPPQEPFAKHFSKVKNNTIYKKQ